MTHRNEYGVISMPREQYDKAIADAVAAEREACAKIVDEYAKELGETGVLPRIAGAIRARGETKP